LLCSTAFASSFVIKGTNDKLEINEEFGDATGALTSSNLAELKSGSVKAKEGTTTYNQYIRFKDTKTAIASPIILLDKSDAGDVETFLRIAEGSAVTNAFFEYHLEFEDGLKSKVKDDVLTSIDGAEVNIFGRDYLLVEGTLKNNRINLIFAAGAIVDYLKEGEQKEYTIGEKTYVVNIKTIDATSKSAILTVNGKDLQKLSKAETVDLGDGLTLGVTDVLVSAGDNNFVQFFIGAELLEFEDTNYADDSFNKGVKLNKEKIADAFVKVSASLVNDVLKISDIKYRALVKTNIHLKIGEKLSSYMKDVKPLLGVWDLTFDGLNSVASSQISFIPSGNEDEYTLSFKNLDSLSMNVPFVSNKGSFKFGDDDQDVVFVEASSQTGYNIDQSDYFVLTSSNAKTGKTYIMKYDSIDTQEQTLQFEQVGGGSKSVPYTNATSGILGEAELTVGSVTAKINIEDASGNKLAIDQNGDGDHAGDEMNLIVEGGGILDMGSSNSIAGSTHSITLTTPNSKLEESSTDETITIVFDTTLGPKASIQSSFSGLTTYRTSGNHVLGLTPYGSFYDLTDTQGNAAVLSIHYPKEQVFTSATISLAAGKAGLSTNIKNIKVTTCSNGKQDGDETGVDCGGSCGACASCFDRQKNQDETGVDCGGSCEKRCEPKKDEKKGECADGCLQSLSGKKTVCLKVGDIVKERYCAVDQSIKAQKRNGMVCSADYECLTKKCVDSKCGRKVTVVQWAVNGVILLIILGVLWYGFVLLRR
tara:strand:+ start:32803 stop:35082 length:2280 start_codon:yes stop_codon:yes gene_type:complete